MLRSSELEPALAGAVVHRLHPAVVLVPAAVEDEARTLRRADDLLAHPEVAPHAPVLARLWSAQRHHFPPALPAFRRICSPTYLIPFPLYGSGGRSERSSAATCPTTSLSAPSTRIAVGWGAV